jgi:hypothetical protein
VTADLEAANHTLRCEVAGLIQAKADLEAAVNLLSAPRNSIVTTFRIGYVAEAVGGSHTALLNALDNNSAVPAGNISITFAGNVPWVTFANGRDVVVTFAEPEN